MNKSTSLIFFLFLLCNGVSAQTVIRLNQLGYEPASEKIVVILSEKRLNSSQFSLLTIPGKRITMSGRLQDTNAEWGEYKYIYKADFSSVTDTGTFILQIGRTRSDPFTIAENLYKPLIDSLYFQFLIQRCGSAQAKMHGICHTFDVQNVWDDPTIARLDLTGGWHTDANYGKSVLKASFITHYLFSAYEYYSASKSAYTDLLFDEAFYGLEWLVKCNYKEDKLVAAVYGEKQSIQDELPEDDLSQKNRYALIANNERIYAMYAATMAKSAKILKSRGGGRMSEVCLEKAYNLYNLLDFNRESIQSPDTLLLLETIAAKGLAAVEMYKATSQIYHKIYATNYFHKLIDFNNPLTSPISNLFLYEIAHISSEAFKYAQMKYEADFEYSKRNPFAEPFPYTSKMNRALLGNAIFRVMMKPMITDSTKNENTMHYLLGCNPWGISFISNIGTHSVSHLHSQIAQYYGGSITGAIVNGAEPQWTFLLDSSFPHSVKIEGVNTQEAYFEDTRTNRFGNQPDLELNALALFYFLQFTK